MYDTDLEFFDEELNSRIPILEHKNNAEASGSVAMAPDYIPETTHDTNTNILGGGGPGHEGAGQIWSIDEYGPEFLLPDSDYEQEPATWPSISNAGIQSPCDEASAGNVTKDGNPSTCLEPRSFQSFCDTSAPSEQEITVDLSSVGLVAANSNAPDSVNRNEELMHEYKGLTNEAEEPQATVSQYSQSVTEAIAWDSSSRHISFDFSLVGEIDGVPFPRPPTFWEIYAIGMYFGDNCSDVLFDCPFLVIRFKVLPKKPWPVTIAGLPAWIIDARSNNFPPFFGNRGTSRTRFILDDFAPIPYWKTPNVTTFDGIIGFFRSEGLDIKSLTFLGNRWLATFRGKRMFYTESLPAQVGGMPIFYNEEMDSFTQRRQRNMESCTSNRIESSYYTELMVAGMMVSSNNNIFTISGTPLYNEITEELCVTVSNHGFDISDIVYCCSTLDGARKPIAVTFKNVEQTGIMLAPVKPRKAYIKEHLGDHCFLDKYLSGVEGLVVGTQLYRMDSPWTEPCEPVLVGIERTVEPGLQHLGESPEIYQTNVLTYVSNDPMFPDQYFCGAQVFEPLTNEVIALFQCGRNVHGVFSSASVEPLLHCGYQIPKADSDGLFPSVSEG